LHPIFNVGSCFGNAVTLGVAGGLDVGGWLGVQEVEAAAGTASCVSQGRRVVSGRQRAQRWWHRNELGVFGACGTAVGFGCT